LTLTRSVYVADRLIAPFIWIGAISVARRDVKTNLSKIVKKLPDWKFARRVSAHSLDPGDRVRMIEAQASCSSIISPVAMISKTPSPSLISLHSANSNKFLSFLSSGCVAKV
jgi:hypothetical protein